MVRKLDLFLEILTPPSAMIRFFNVRFKIGLKYFLFLIKLIDCFSISATFIFCCLSWCVLGAFVRGNELACSSDSDCELLELWVTRGDDNCCLDNRCWNDCSTYEQAHCFFF